MDAWVAHMHASPLGKNIRVPQVYWDLTTERVLTMERDRRASASTTPPPSARPASTAPSW